MNLRSIRIGRLAGIPIGVQPLWLVIVFLIAWSLGAAYYPDQAPGIAPAAAYALGLLSALLLFVSILLHELGHSVVARRHGVEIEEIDLWLLGGVARMKGYPKTAGDELRFALAGPAVTLAIALGFGLLDLALPASSPDALRALVDYQLFINAAILVFNLLPAFPMDGGRIVRAIAWWRTGDRTAATRVAAGLGRVFSYVFVGGGLLMVFTGEVFAGVWLALIGMVINGSARAASAQTAITGRIEGIRVADIMDREPVYIPDQLSVEEALDEYFLRYRWAWFPVVDAAHRFVGLVVRDKADEVPEVSRATSRVSDVVELDDGTFQVRDDAPLDSLLANRALRRFGALMAIDAEGRLSGVITAEQVGRALRDAAG